MFFFNQINSSWIGFVAPIVFFDGVDDIIVKIVNKIQKTACLPFILCLTVAIFPDFENQNIGGDNIEIS